MLAVRQHPCFMTAQTHVSVMDKRVVEPFFVSFLLAKLTLVSISKLFFYEGRCQSAEPSLPRLKRCAKHSTTVEPQQSDKAQVHYWGQQYTFFSARTALKCKSTPTFKSHCTECSAPIGMQSLEWERVTMKTKKHANIKKKTYRGQKSDRACKKLSYGLLTYWIS